jgi:hypothetical protein
MSLGVHPEYHGSPDIGPRPNAAPAATAGEVARPPTAASDVAVRPHRNSLRDAEAMASFMI